MISSSICYTYMVSPPSLPCPMEPGGIADGYVQTEHEGSGLERTLFTVAVRQRFVD